MASKEEIWAAEMAARRHAYANKSTCKYCGNGIRWEKYWIDGEKIYRWKAINADGTDHGKCRDKMGITKQYTWKKKDRDLLET